MTDPLHLVVLDDKRGRDAILSGGFHVLLVRGAIRISSEVVARLLLPLVGVEELGDGLQLLVADANDDHRVLVLLRHIAQVRHAHAARSTPGGPELHHVHLAWFKPLWLGATHELLNDWLRGSATDGHRLRRGVRLRGVLRRDSSGADESERCGLRGAPGERRKCALHDVDLHEWHGCAVGRNRVGRRYHSCP